MWGLMEKEERQKVCEWEGGGKAVIGSHRGRKVREIMKEGERWGSETELHEEREKERLRERLRK